jgi:hypothetical protein
MQPAAVSELALAPRTAAAPGRPPLVLDNSGSSTQERYFPWLARPAGARIEPGMDRSVLPGTSWRHEWVYPETDFLVDKLLVLDAPLVAERVYGASGDGPESHGSRVLLPLTARFFEFFRPEDVPGMLDMRVAESENALRVQVTQSLSTILP